MMYRHEFVSTCCRYSSNIQGSPPSVLPAMGLISDLILRWPGLRGELHVRQRRCFQKPQGTGVHHMGQKLALEWRLGIKERTQT